MGESHDNEKEATCEFTLALKDVVTGRGEGKWAANGGGSVDCTLSLLVKVKAASLTMTLTINNTGDVDFEYQTLLHTYYKINGSKALCNSSCNVQGLEGYHVDDKITAERSVQDAAPIGVDREVDRIFTPPSDKHHLDVRICAGDSKISLKATATDGQKDIPVSVVVWNPFVDKAKRLSDFDDDEYHDMLCVEPGILSGTECVLSGKKVTFEQVIAAIS